MIEQFLMKLKKKRQLNKKQVQRIKDEIHLGISLRITYFYYAPDLGMYLLSRWYEGENYIEIVEIKNGK